MKTRNGSRRKQRRSFWKSRGSHHRERLSPRPRRLAAELLEERALLSVAGTWIEQQPLSWPLNVDPAEFEDATSAVVPAAWTYALKRATDLQTYNTEQLASASDWVIGFSGQQDPTSLVSLLDRGHVESAGYIANAYIWELPEGMDPLSVPEQLGSLAEVDFFYPLVARQRDARWGNDPFFPNQWHLKNTGQTGGTPGADANVVPAWNRGHVGARVVIGIVDDGIDYSHPDLADQYRADLSYDFLGSNPNSFTDRDADASPNLASDNHGTAVAGVAAAEGNLIGVSGAAPGAKLAALRLISDQEGTTDKQEADALSYKTKDIDIYNNSWGPADGKDYLDGPFPLTLAAIETAVTNGRDGLGSIYVWAAGNGLLEGDNVNYDGYANSRYTIAVSAIDDDGKQWWGSEPGAPILVAAYGAADLLVDIVNDWRVDITTTDRRGTDGYNSVLGSTDGDGLEDLDYTSTFGSTSAATPLVSGVIALMLDAKRNLTWRDVQHILVETVEKNDAGDLDWQKNAAGHDINHKYGFGAIDAYAAVRAAENWTNVGPEVSTTSGRKVVNAAIPDNNLIGVTSTVTINEDLNVEWVEVVFNASHNFRGDLEVVLTAPSGTKSILAEEHGDDGNDYNDWVFTSARHWGESSAGTWKLTVRDRDPEVTGRFDSWRLNIYGTAAAEAPEIEVRGNGQDIADADTTPSTLDGTDFGTVVQGEAGPEQPFTVRNHGTGTLTLGSVSVPAGFTITEDLDSRIPENGSDTFTVRLDSMTPGMKSGEISFSNNDADENPFNFLITGTVMPELPHGEIRGRHVFYNNSAFDHSVSGIREGVSGDGVPDLIVTPQGLVIDTDGATITRYTLESDAGILTGDPPNNLGKGFMDTDHRIVAANFAFGGTHMLGNVIGAEFSDADLFQDLTFRSYTTDRRYVGTLIWPAANDDARAHDKMALMPGQTATFANYTSYSRGINGIMVDIAGLPDGLTPTAADFGFRVGNSDDPTTWPDAPRPNSVTIRPGEGTDGSDRVTIIWPDYAIRNQWLEVTVPTNNFGLAADDVFYFGNAVAESGNSDADARVTATDLLLARNNPRNDLDPAGIESRYDYNRDGKVNTTDVLLARNHQTNFLTALRLLDLSGPQAAGADESSPAFPPATGPDASLDDLAWLAEYEQTATRPHRSKDSDAAAAAVDQLLATYWP